MWTTVASLLLVLVAAVYFFCKRRYCYFEELGVRSKPALPFIGSLWRSILGRKHMLNDLVDTYNEFPEEKYFGIYEGVNPVLVIRDPEIIKKVTVKDFDYFVDHRNMFMREGDEESLASKGLFFLKGQKWRDMRGSLSPAFTGAKMRMMIPFMAEISHQLVDYLKAASTDGGNGKITEPMDVYDLFTRFSNDVIASCAFGLKVDSLKNKDNEFFILGRLITNFRKFNFFMNSLFPRISKLFRISIFPEEATDFFRRLVSETMKHREDNHIVRHDMINLLMEAKNGTLKYTSLKDDNVGFATTEESEIKTVKRKWTNDDLAAQAFLFFLAGFDTTSTSLTFAVHELTINPDIQEKLRAEVDACHVSSPELTYEVIQGFKYMDGVISEVLRKWVSGITLDRVCMRDYKFEPPRPGAEPYIMKKNQHLYVYVRAMHMDEKYYSNPEKFDPERYSDERKHEIQPITYLPFGIGPRNCIGSRFALMQMKIMLYILMRNFELVPCEKTTNPIQFGNNGMRIEIAGGTWVQFKPRMQTSSSLN